MAKLGFHALRPCAAAMRCMRLVSGQEILHRLTGHWPILISSAKVVACPRLQHLHWQALVAIPPGQKAMRGGLWAL